MPEYSQHFLTALLSRWLPDADRATIEPHVRSSGLSGARVWRVTHEGRLLCLKRWPTDHLTAEEVIAIHGLLRHIAREGFDCAPAPLGVTLAEQHVWELVTWAPGEPYDRERGTRAQRTEALRRLALFHLAAQSYPGATVGVAPGLGVRLKRLRELQSEEQHRLRIAVSATPAAPWGLLAKGLLEQIERATPLVLPRLERRANVRLPLQMCLRDVKYDHVLFDGDRMVGLIDFGAAAIDSVAGDIARLLGSMVGDEREEWAPAINAYHAVRPLSADEHEAIDLFDEGGTVAAAANWLHWLYVEGRTFPDTRVVEGQLRWLHARLQAIVC